MKLCSLGRSPLRVSSLAYGCWRLAGSEGGPAVTGSQTGKRAVHAAVDAGYTCFDLADIYGGGRCEEIFGETLRESPGLRDRLVIATKCGIRRANDPTPDAPFRYDFSGEYLLQAVENSLRRLGVEMVDLLMLHRPDFLMNPSEVAGVFATLRDAGKVREFGVSNFLPSQFTALQRACPFPLIVNQIELSLRQMSPFTDGTLDQCLSETVTPMAWSPLARGALTADSPAPSIEAASPKSLGEVLDVVARTHETSRAVIALAWLLKHPARILPVVGSTNPGRIAELTQAESIRLSREEWYRMLEASRGTRLP
ncbi:MAG TPA: aldo/keto reductase [Verrucomicrobiota bacterium]|nr:aldo/keto reductase [Verrucomicrobiota bacterium]